MRPSASPSRLYQALKAAITPIFGEYRRLTSQGQREFKHSEFKRLAHRDRRRLAMKIRDAFRANGVFINVFYTPLRSFVMEHMRTRLFFGKQREIPADFEHLYEEAAQRLKEEAQGPGQSGLIKKLLLLPIGGVANMLATFESSFAVIYDPREKKEDRAVITAIDSVLAAFTNLKDKDVDLRWDLHLFVKGFVHDRLSENEIGLQMADLMAGETRAFFDANPELMEFAASRKLITQGLGRAVGDGGTGRGQAIQDRRSESPAGGAAETLVRAGSGGAVPCYPCSESCSAPALRRATPVGGSPGTSQSSTGTCSINWSDRATDGPCCGAQLRRTDSASGRSPQITPCKSPSSDQPGPRGRERDRRLAGPTQMWVWGLVRIQLRPGSEPDSTGARTVVPARSAAHSLLGVGRPQPTGSARRARIQRNARSAMMR